jgi:UDPglucose 6-dehydrogenase
MKICVYGLWHLGSVTAACLAAGGIDVIGLDPDPAVIANLARGKAPLFEPGLDELINEEIGTGRLHFTTAAPNAVGDADLVWVTFDTPVDDDDRADAAAIERRIEAIFPDLRDGVIVVISSQLPVGTTTQLERRFAAQASGRSVIFAYSPENLRLGQALKSFLEPKRIIVGTRRDRGRTIIASVLERFCPSIVWMSIESAEMSKHALNTFLATSITLTNEIATLCERVGADASEVEAALRSEPRIGPNAYVRAGTAFAGGTLARDVQFLSTLGADRGAVTPVINAVLASNNEHRHWTLNRLREGLDGLTGRTIAILGLAYKAGTDSLRRSVSIELCHSLVDGGARVQAYDPKVTTLPDSLANAITTFDSAAEAITGADALVVATEWPEFKELSGDIIMAGLHRPFVIDPSGFLAASLACDARIKYLMIGRAV